AAREMLDVPVVGITEAALLTACLLGTRIGVIVYGRRTLPLYQELVASHGFTGRIAGWRVLETTAVYGDGDQAAADAAAIAAANDLVERDFAEVVVLTGAVMAGVPPRLQPSVPVPLLEGVGLAVRQAEMLVDLKPVKPRFGGYAPLPVRELVDVDPVLAARFGGT
ncbi:MAG: aspartate/glutamate racemase family protein, partial [Rhizobacter sp.]